MPNRASRADTRAINSIIRSTFCDSLSCASSLRSFSSLSIISIRPQYTRLWFHKQHNILWVLDSYENCTWNDIVKCGGCAQYSLKYGRTKCFNSSTGVGESDCNNECLECKVATYKPGVYCVNFRYDEGGCKNAKCEFYIASVSEKSLQDILFVQE